MAASARWLFVARLRWTVDSAALAQYFSKFGRVQRATVQIDTRSGRSKGYGFVTMADKTSVSDILTRRTHNIEGKRVEVSMFKKGQQKDTRKGVQGGRQAGEEEAETEDV